MARQRKQPDSDQPPGAPEWMVTFSDCMTLLLTFFVLLLSFSSFDDQANYKKMNSSFAQSFSFGSQGTSEKDAVTVSLPPQQEIYWGSEKPTLSEGTDNRFKKQTDAKNYLKYQTFMVASNEIFWGTGSAISKNGKNVLADLSAFLREFPNYFIIVSESGPDDAAGETIGFDRAWAVFNFLSNEKGIGADQLNISAGGTAVKEYHANQLRRDNADGRRMLEIVLLRRSR